MQVSVATTILLIKALIWLHDYLKQLIFTYRCRAKCEIRPDFRHLTKQKQKNPVKKSLLRHHSAYCEIPTHFFGFNDIIVIIILGLIPAVQYFCLGKIKAVPMTEVAIKKRKHSFHIAVCSTPFTN